jgi:putative DNA primase/helicase
LVAERRKGKLSAAERQRIDENKSKADADRERRRSIAELKAGRLLERAIPVVSRDEDPYLIAKGIGPHAIRRLPRADLLVVPLSDPASHLRLNLQIIGADGSKFFLRGGRVAGCYFSIADNFPERQVSEICTAEGFATAASIHEGTQIPTVAAFNAGNLRTVAEALRKQYSKAKLIICADNDRNTKGNPGTSKATEAARAVRGS